VSNRMRHPIPATPILQKTRPQRPIRPYLRTLEHLLQDETIKPRRSLLGTWLLERGLVMLHAPTGVGKSWLALGIAAAVAGGGSLGNHKAPNAHRVLYIDGEMDIADLKDRLSLLVPATPDADPNVLCRNLLIFARSDQKTHYTFPNFGEEADRDQILTLVRDFKPSLVILDNLSTLASVPEENAGEAWDDLLALLLHIKDAGASVLVVHHSNKQGESYRGSSKLAVLFDTIMSLKEDRNGDTNDGVACLWSFQKMRMYAPETRAGSSVRFTDGRWQFESAYDPIMLDVVKGIRNLEFTLQKEAAEKYGMTPVALSKLLREADRLGILLKKERDECLQEARDLERDDRPSEF